MIPFEEIQFERNIYRFWWQRAFERIQQVEEKKMNRFALLFDLDAFLLFFFLQSSCPCLCIVYIYSNSPRWCWEFSNESIHYKSAIKLIASQPFELSHPFFICPGALNAKRIQCETIFFMFFMLILSFVSILINIQEEQLSSLNALRSSYLLGILYRMYNVPSR